MRKMKKGKKKKESREKKELSHKYPGANSHFIPHLYSSRVIFYVTSEFTPSCPLDEKESSDIVSTVSCNKGKLKTKI